MHKKQSNKWSLSEALKMILEILATILILIADWQLFKKMGREGWEGIIPLYNNYVLCEEMYYSG